ncbi:fibronectin type III domain-containing protein [Cohnella herbarum]|uniref:Fibronectin type III domain-containing protein n=1 Tax=Cohnella herbarum TaxID=2728023 RepID=A0A7Z2ZPR3_9BACL|nr:fibronectin type III domain-containing protein [Cohnella herbarum]QJD87741.1 fibronectin type III domain-containing protein [Cohnella herbarum]
MKSKKWLVAFIALMLLIPAMSANAATGAYVTNVTSNSLTLSWTLQPGENYVYVYKDGSLYSTMAGNGINVTGLSPCTTYNFNVVSGQSGYTSTSTIATTLGCDPTPTAPVITYTTGPFYNINLSWTSTNATNYDIYKDNAFVANTTNTSYTISGSMSTTHAIKIVAKNNTGQSASSTIYVTSPGFSNSWTATLNAGNIRVGTAIANQSYTTSTTMYMDLYRVTASGDVFVASTSVYLNPSQSTGGWYNLAYGQPAGTYKITLHSAYATTSGVSLGNF